MSNKMLAFLFCFSFSTLIASPANAEWNLLKTIYVTTAGFAALLVTGATFWGIAEHNGNKKDMKQAGLILTAIGSCGFTISFFTMLNILITKSLKNVSKHFVTGQDPFKQVP